MVDYLKLKGKDSSPEGRKKLWTDLGLEARNGAYARTGQQNINLLNALKQQDTDTSAKDYLSSLGYTNPDEGELEGAREELAAQNTIKTISNVQPQAKPAVEQAQTTTPPQVTTPQTTTPAADALGAFGYQPPAQMTPEEVMTKAQATPEAGLATERQDLGTLKATSEMEVEKQKIMAEYNTKVDEIENDLGLSFSGARGKALETLTQNLAVSMLGADRQLAFKLLESDIGAREKFLGIAEKVIKEANDNNKTALDQLNKAGFAMVGGKLMPTAEALRIAQTAGTAEFNQMIQLERLKISSRLANTSEERNSILNQMRMVNLQKQTSVSPGQVVSASSGLPVDLTQGESEMISRQQMVDNYYIPSLLTKLEGIETGAVVGKLNKYTANMPVAQYLRNEDLSMFNAMASYMSQQIVYMNSGKQINEAEMKILQQSLPSAELTVSENRKRLQQFQTLTGKTLDTFLTANGWTISESSPEDNIVTSELGGADDLSDLDFSLGE